MEKPIVRISDVLDLLDNGKSREQIAEHYGLTMADVRRLFKHEKLKGKKAKKQGMFELVDDIPAEGEVEEIRNYPTMTDDLEVTNPDELLENEPISVEENTNEVQDEEVTSQWDN